MKLAPTEKYAVSPSEAAQLLSIDRATFYRHVMPAVFCGAIASFKIGGCRRIITLSLLAWAEQQSGREAA